MSTVVWTIAGFDPSSGAGVTADLMTFAAHALFGCSAITALTVQSTLGVLETEPVRAALLERTLDHLAADLPPRGVKIGMLGSADNAAVVGRFLERALRSSAGLPKAPVVLDPVLRSSSGRDLYPETAVAELHSGLLPLADWITPNWPELAALTGAPVSTPKEAKAAMQRLAELHPQLNVVATGGDQATPTDLFLSSQGQYAEIQGEHIQTAATHGTGCAFSSALLAYLVLGAAGEDAVRGAKRFVEGALRHAPGVGRGKGPMGLLWPLAGSNSRAGNGC